MSGDDDLCYLTASEAIAQFTARTLSPVELMRAVIARSEAVNPVLNAFTATHYDRALEQARVAEAVYMRADGSARPLEGIPIAIKDFHPVENEITTFGSTICKDNRTTVSAPTVKRLLDAGAIMHCRTTTPEFALGLITHSALWGVTRNPWNLEYSPCGSSGGAGAALAAGMTTLADGTDSGGSIRAPASACGLFGYLPPHGRNPSDRSFAYEGLLRYGPMARSVADAALMQNVTAGWHPEDPATLREQIRLPPAFGPLRGMRIALSLDLGYYEIDHEVAAAVRCAAAVFAGLGCTVTEIALPWTTAVADAMNIYVEYLVHAGYGSLLPSNGAEMSAHVSHLISRGATLRGADVAFFFATRRTMYEQIRPILEEFDLLLCPTLATPGVVAEHNSMDPAFTINGKPVGAYLEWGLTYPFNMLCYLPVASVPCGFARNNLPIGMQLVGRTFDDLSVFHAAAAFEAAQPWRDRRPTLPSLTKS